MLKASRLDVRSLQFPSTTAAGRDLGDLNQKVYSRCYNNGREIEKSWRAGEDFPWDSACGLLQCCEFGDVPLEVVGNLCAVPLEATGHEKNSQRSEGSLEHL